MARGDESGKAKGDTQVRKKRNKRERKLRQTNSWFAKIQKMKARTNYWIIKALLLPNSKEYHPIFEDMGVKSLREIHNYIRAEELKLGLRLGREVNYCFEKGKQQHQIMFVKKEGYSWKDNNPMNIYTRELVFNKDYYKK